MSRFKRERIGRWAMGLGLVACWVFSGCQPAQPPRAADSEGKGKAPAEAAAVKLEEAEFLARSNRAIGLMGRYDYPAAYREFAELLALRPDDRELRVNTAIARLNMAGDADIQEAIRLLETVLNEEPQHLRANYTLGLLKLYQGPPADPRSNFAVVAAADPDDADAAYLHAQSLEQSRELAAAQAEYARCLKLNEYYASALLGLSRLARMEGKAQLAVNWVQNFEAIKANPNSRVFEFIYRRMGKYSEVSGLGTEPQSERQLKPAGSVFGPARTVISRTPDAGAIREMILADLVGDAALECVLVCERPTGERSLEIWETAPEPNDWRRVEVPWTKEEGARTLLCGDLDDDGQTDVVVCGTRGCRAWLRDATGGWSAGEEEALAGLTTEVVSGLLLDADHDGDLDLLAITANGELELLNNNRDGSFRRLTEEDGWSPGLGKYQRVLAGDFDNDRDLDLYAFGREGGTLFWNERLWEYRREENLPGSLAAPGLACCQDLDHDGRLELLKANEAELQAWQWQAGEWRQLGRSQVLAGPCTELAQADLDGDGETELLAQVNGKLFRYSGLGGEGEEIAGELSGITAWNLAWTGERGWGVLVAGETALSEVPPGPGRHRFVGVTFSGKQKAAESMRSNASGIGTRWKARVGTRWTSGVSLPVGTWAGQSLQPSAIGLSGQQLVDLLAIDWTDGVFQSELGLEPGEGAVLVEETQRQLASCPLIFAWNGERMEFVSDVLGVGGIGFLVAPGEYAPPRPWENFAFESGQLSPRAGRFQIRIGEPMEEACYLKSVRLFEVGLPAGWEMIIDERAGVSDPQPTGDFCFFRESWPVESARDGRGETMTEHVRSADGRAAEVGPLDRRFVGLLQTEQQLEFTFGTVSVEPKGGRPALAIKGWIEYPYSQTVFAAAQAGRRYEAPSLEVSEDGVAWRMVWAELGYPAGMPREMLIPLPAEAIGAKWYRLRTNMQVYWDQIRLVNLEDCPSVSVRELALEKAELRRVGFAERTTGPQFRPWYDYSRRRGVWDARHLPGWFTAFGDCLASLCGPGVVVFGPGEEVQLEFAAKSDREVSGARHVLKLEGWCKDMDLYTAGGDELGAIPGERGELGFEIGTEQEGLRNRYESGPWYSRPWSGERAGR